MVNQCIDERCHIFGVLKNVLKALEQKDYVEVKNSSNKIIHTSSISQDPDVISVAVIIYALSKLIERETYKTYKEWPKFFKDYVDGIRNIIKALQKEDIEEFRNQVHVVRKTIEELSGNLKVYIQDVFRKAEINKASKIYEHGISMEQTAKLLGISMFELAGYAGQTGISDVPESKTLEVKNRIKLAMEFFE